MPFRPAVGFQHAIARAEGLERAGDIAGALSAYESALRAAPDNPDILATLAELAGRMELCEAAARLWARVSALDPRRLEAVDGRARALRDLGRFDEAVETLRAALLDHPHDPRLWNSLGVTLTQDGQPELAITFLDEAIRLDGRSATAVYNRGNAWFDLGRLDAAQADFDRAGKLARQPADAATVAFAAATLSLARGALQAGWDAYEARLSRHWPKATAFDAPGRRWRPHDDLSGRRLLVVAEQGLGDELMFAGVLPDAQAALGADGRLSLSVEPRLVELFRRSFPRAEISAHATARVRGRLRRSAPGVAEPRAIDLWAPMGSLPRRFRRRLEDFPATRGYLRPDPARVARWRAWLGDGRPAVGISWRSGKTLGDRRRQYPPSELWARLLQTPGARFVNVQYGDCAEELAAFRAQTGAEILEPPGLDVREDIDGLAGLLAALPLTVSVANATGALGGAIGANVALIGAPVAWPRLGTERLPWYPQAHALNAAAFGQWAPVMDAAAARVAGLSRRPGRPTAASGG